MPRGFPPAVACPGASPAHTDFVASPFHYQEPFPLGPDLTSYRRLTAEHVSLSSFDGVPVLKVDPAALTLLANQAFHDINFYLRTSHLEQVVAILADPESSANDRAVALAMLRNAEVAAKGVLPFCQDTGTAQVVAKKGQQVWTGGDDAEALSLGIFQAYAQNNLRYSQLAALDMYTERNTGTNLPAQIDITAGKGSRFDFLFVAKGGGSANKCFLYQETKAVLNPKSLVAFLTEIEQLQVDPDLVAKIEDICVDECSQGNVTVWVTVGNQGYTDITDPFKIEVIGETDTGEVILKSVDWTVGLVMGHQSDSLSIELTGVPTPLYNIRVAVDGGNSESLSEISECYETNNEDNWGSIICL